MEISPIEQAFLLFYSFLFGIGMGFFYDVCRIVRAFFGVRYSVGSFEKLYSLKIPFIDKKIEQKSKRRFRKIAQCIVVFVGDMLSLLIASVGIIVLNYAYNSGRFRFFTVLGVIIGFLMYYFTLGRLVMLVSEPVVILVKYVFLSFLVVIGYPIKLFFCFLLKNIKKCVFLYSFTLENRTIKLYNIKEEKYLFQMSKNGFLDVKLEDL